MSDNIEMQVESEHLDPNTQGFLLSESVEEFQFVEEATEGGKPNYAIKGIFLQANLINRNKRFYPTAVMEKAVEVYRPKIESGEAYGELDHPNSPGLHAQFLSHRITELNRSGTNWEGKAQIFEHTPQGKALIGLFKEGVKLGVSSRGFAKLIPDRAKGIVIVQDNFRLTTGADVVLGPSAPDANVKMVTEADRIIAESLVYNGNLLNYDYLTEAWVKGKQQEIMEASSSELETKVLPELLQDYLNQL